MVLEASLEVFVISINHRLLISKINNSSNRFKREFSIVIKILFVSITKGKAKGIEK